MCSFIKVAGAIRPEFMFHFFFFLFLDKDQFLPLLEDYYSKMETKPENEKLKKSLEALINALNSQFFDALTGNKIRNNNYIKNYLGLKCIIIISRAQYNEY